MNVFCIGTNKIAADLISNLMLKDYTTLWDIQIDMEKIKRSTPELIIFFNQSEEVLKAIHSLKQFYSGPLLYIGSQENTDLLVSLFMAGIHDCISCDLPLFLINKKIDVYKKMKSKKSNKEQIIEIKNDTTYWRLNNNNLTILFDKDEKRLTLSEWKILNFLIQHINCIVSKKQIMSHWFPHLPSESRIVDNKIADIRSKLPDFSDLETIRGVGYRISGKVSA